MNALDHLRRHTIVVADTGEIDRLARLQPRDATTNPSLILKAVALPAYQPLLAEAKAQPGSPQSRLNALLVRFGALILQAIPGRVSTELDAAASFDREACIRQAHALIEAYAQAGISADRVLIKIAASWEGISAAAALERADIHCNLTLIFGMSQAWACADAGVQLISPFVGRISDWHKAKGEQWSSPEEDPGVQFVRRVYRGYKRHGIRTEVMGASFRTADQVLALAGCDLLTVSPALLEALAEQSLPEDTQAPLSLSPEGLAGAPDRQQPDEATFRFGHNEDAMATEKLAEGIRLFVRDGQQLLALLSEGR